jgi:hypothetical protein
LEELKEEPMTDKTIVSFLLDETGSMDSVRDKTVSGFNEYVATLQNTETPTLLRLMTFNTDGFNVVYDFDDIHSVADLTRESYRPRALTNLYDAIAKLVHDTEDYAKRMSPTARVMCTIMTDGEENSSSEYTRAAIFKLITDREKEGWAFAYLGANQDAWAASESIGIHRRNSANYQADAPDVALRSTADATSRWVRRQRKAGKVERFFVEEDLVKIKGPGP